MNMKKFSLPRRSRSCNSETSEDSEYRDGISPNASSGTGSGSIGKLKFVLPFSSTSSSCASSSSSTLTRKLRESSGGSSNPQVVMMADGKRSLSSSSSTCLAASPTCSLTSREEELVVSSSLPTSANGAAAMMIATSTLKSSSTTTSSTSCSLSTTGSYPKCDSWLVTKCKRVSYSLNRKCKQVDMGGCQSGWCEYNDMQDWLSEME